MTDAEKKLLMKDLCGRLPYGVKFTLVGNEGNVYCATGVKLGVADDGEFGYFVTAFDISPIKITGVKPYLRPMSSMTEEELIHYSETREWKYVDDDHYEHFDTLESFDWLNANHFDYRGLIPMGLVLEAPEDMYV